MVIDNLFNEPFGNGDKFVEMFGVSKHSLSIGDKITVATPSRDIEFELEAVNSVGEYVFMSSHCVGYESMKNIINFLESFESNLDPKLLELISPCEHLGGSESNEGGLTNGRKIWIPSFYNVCMSKIGKGKDDVHFEGNLKCRDGLEGYYFTDTKSGDDSNYYNSVRNRNDYGECRQDYRDDICVCFSI